MASDAQREDIINKVESMLRDEVNGMKTLDGDDWQSLNRFDVGDRIYLRCAFYHSPAYDDYIWEIKDQTTIEIDITDGPTPTDGATAVVECDVAARIGEEKIKLGSPKIVDFKIADKTIEELTSRIH